MGYHKHDHQSLEDSYSVATWNDNFLKIDQTVLFELIIAADYLDMQRLLQIIRENILNITGMRNAHEIFKIQNYSELKMLHQVLNLLNLSCCTEGPLIWGNTEPWGVITRILTSGINEVFGPDFEEIQSRFPSITSIENSLNWIIDSANRSLQIVDNEINAIYTERVLDLCIKKYLCTIPNHTIRLEDFYTETLLGEGHLSGSLNQTFEDHFSSYKYIYTPYDFASSKFLALSYLLHKKLTDNIENTIENLPKINELTLATVLQNIEEYIFPFRKLRHFKIGTSRSLLIHVEVDNNAGHYLLIVPSSTEQIIETIKYEILLYILSSTSNFVCNSITIYNPVIGKKYTTKCNLTA